MLLIIRKWSPREKCEKAVIFVDIVIFPSPLTSHHKPTVGESEIIFLEGVILRDNQKMIVMNVLLDFDEVPRRKCLKFPEKLPRKFFNVKVEKCIQLS